MFFLCLNFVVCLQKNEFFFSSFELFINCVISLSGAKGIELFIIVASGLEIPF